MKAAIALIHRRYLPRAVLAVRDSSSSDPTGAQSGHLNEIFAGKESLDGQPVLYVCQNFACQSPMTGLESIEAKLSDITGSSVISGPSILSQFDLPACEPCQALRAAAITAAKATRFAIAMLWHASYSGMNRTEPSGK